MNAGAMKVWTKFKTPTLGVIPAYLLFFVVAGAPLPFGSFDKTTIAFWCMVLGLAAITSSLANYQLRRGHLLILGGIGMIILSYAFVLHEQLADHPWIAKPNPIWTKTSAILGQEITPSVSIVRGEPFFALGAPLACVLALIGGLVIGTDRDRARQLLQVIAWSGAAYAVYGILSFLIEPTMLLWSEKRAYLGSVTGTFINRNTAATYFGSCAVVWLTILLEQIRRHLRTNKIVWKMLPARILTGSRAGVVLSLLALIVTFVVYFRRDLPPRSGVWIALAGGAAFALILLQFMGGVVSNRFDVSGLADEGRVAAYRSTLRMIADNPWFGSGLGTFAWNFPAYRSPEISMYGVWDIAHITPLELASEVGLPLAGAVCISWIVMLAVLVHGIRTRHRDTIIPLAALSASIIGNLHSWIDFSLQIPGYAIVVFALVGAGLAQSFGTKRFENAHVPVRSAEKIGNSA